MVTVVDTDGVEHDILLQAAESTLLSDVAGHLAVAVDRKPAPGGDQLYLGGMPVPAETPLGESAVREGCRIGLNRPLPDPGTGTGVSHSAARLRLLVVAGPGAGAIHDLRHGTTWLEDDPSGGVRVGRRPTQDTKLALEDVGSGLHVYRVTDGKRDLDDIDWDSGEQMTFGDVVLELDRPERSDVVLSPAGDGTVRYRRPPRLSTRPAARDKFVPPRPPGALAQLSVLGSGVAAVLLFSALGYQLLASPRHTWPPAVYVAGFAALGVAAAGYALAWWRYRRRARAFKAEVADSIATRRSALLFRYPDAARLYLAATGPHSRLWERHGADPDHLVVRVGTGDGEFPVRFVDAEDEQKRVYALRDVPVTVSLPLCGALGIAVPKEHGQRLAAWILAQVAVLHSPADVSVCVLTTRGGEHEWGWLRWLPHARPAAGQHAVAVVGNDAATVDRRLAELAGLIATRRYQRAPGGPAADDPAVVVVLDGLAGFDRPAGVTRLLRDGPPAGVYVVCVEDDVPSLPEECRAIVVADGSHLNVRQPDGTMLQAIRPDLVPWPWFDEVARALAPIRDANRPDPEAAVPDRCDLLDLFGIGELTPAVVAARWRESAPGSASAPVGCSSDGTYAVDLRRDGPHLLLGGTTGSGKSVFLTTMILSFALAHPPDAVTFLLVDYKGGGAFYPVADLPHTVGVLTDVGSYPARRLIASLNAEVRRREVLLAAGPGAAPPGAAPRLVIVVDEFAALEAESPDLISALVAIGRQGRSLGIHLVLATQRVRAATAEIRANTNLSIALRVSDPGESADLIGSPIAARIPVSWPGRAYARTAPNVLVPFQTAQVGAGRDAPDGFRRIRVRPLGWRDLGRPPVTDPDGGRLGGSGPDLLVRAVRAAYHGPAPRPPLLPPLGRLVTVAALPVPDPGRDLAPVAYALEDHPDEQAYRPAVMDLTTPSHLLVGGGQRSGRSQFLRTLAGAVAARYRCSDVHLYGLDYGDGALQVLTELPHCGAVVTQTQPVRAARLLGRLTADVRRRQELLAEGGFVSITEQRRTVPAGQRLPHVVLLVDRWDRLVEWLAMRRSGVPVDQVTGLLWEGGRVGIHVVLTGDPAVLRGRFATTAPEHLLLPVSRADANGIGVSARLLPSDWPPGRAVRLDSGVEAQVALLEGGPDPAGQAAALTALGAAARERDVGVTLSQRPFRVDELPLVADRFHVGDASGRPVGREDVLAWLRDRYATGASAALLGPRRAGKSWVLAELARRIEHDGATAVHKLVIPTPDAPVDTPDRLAVILDPDISGAASPAAALLRQVQARAGSGDRTVFLLDEVGRLVAYHPAAVSWLRDLGQQGAWLVYTGTEKDWHMAVRWALTMPGSSFGNDVNARVLGPLERQTALTFLSGTAANLGVNIEPDTTGLAVVDLVDTWPFYLQVVGDALVRAVQGGVLGPLTNGGELARLVQRRLVDDWSHHFEGRWAEIGPAGRAALLDQPGTAPHSLAPAQREDLRDVGLLQPGDRWLPDPPLFNWVARNATELRDRDR